MSTVPSEPAAPAARGEVALEHGAHRAAVVETGAALRSWSVDGEELLDTFAAGRPADSFRGAVLAPWPNRVRDGRYAFGGVEHRLPITEPERSTALHGLVLWARWRVVEQDAAAVTLGHVLRPQPGYPFTLELAIRYELGDDGLAVTLRATNRSAGPAPYGAGLHPYLLAPGGGRVDDCVLRVPAATRLPVDDRMLPSGPFVPVAGTAHDFRAGRAIGPMAIDACYGDLERRGARARALVTVAGGGREIAVWLEEPFRFVHVYTADAVEDPARRRAGIAIEPLTCAPDAFNSGAGLEVLEPGATTTARCGLTVGRA